MKWLICIPCLFLTYALSAQGQVDAWMQSQLKQVSWKNSFKGVLADFHPVTIVLASDYDQVAGYIMHEGDQVKHHLIGDWNKSEHFQLQERDELDRLTGYLIGNVSKDELDMQWMSADKSRLFDVKAFPESLIRIKTFKPIAEWIEVASTPRLLVSIQKMDYGIITGIANRNGAYSRFEGYCLDGTCSLWNTVLQVPGGAPIQLQMRQKDPATYKASLNGIEYTAAVVETLPLTIRKFDNSMGFMDFVYPDFGSAAFNTWVSSWTAQLWNEGMSYLKANNANSNAGRLVQRSSGWIEILDDQAGYISGLITYINPGSTRRSSFVWLKKEDTVLPMEELLNLPADVKKASDLALKASRTNEDEGYATWLKTVGYNSVFPTAAGVVAATEFNMIYGDDLELLPVAASRDMIKRKYWKYFGY
ncbi:MAG TPA: hypothetical protein VJ508_15220 [Saprospiraceae bacterium]|nr:hypothetical protein [Saprospiraceae bacterium]